MVNPIVPDTFSDRQLLLSGDRIVAPMPHLLDPALPDRGGLRQFLHANPWTVVVARDRWIPTLLDLCIAGAVLVGDGTGPPPHPVPLPFPTVILTDAPFRARRSARLWQSIVLRRNPALPEAANLRRALRALNPPRPPMTPRKAE